MSEPDLERLTAALADRYAIQRELGRGGMATVYLAHDVRYERSVALKVLRPDLTATLGAERFQREIQIAARLQHPHILPMLDAGEAAGLLYYVMPYVEGPTLRTRLAREGELPIADVVRILRDVVDGVAAAHALGVVHRDLKPENIMLSGRHALVADFGVAKALGDAAGEQRLTTAGVALGTPAYMAPEQAAGDAQTDHRADIYALGVLAYEMLTGDPPFTRSTPRALLAAQVTEAPVPVTERRDTVPPALASLVMRCLAKKPADRPQRAEELLTVLESLATPSGGMTLDSRRVAARRPGGKRRLALAALGFAVLAMIGGLVVLRLLLPRPLNVTASNITAVTTDPGVEYLPAISPDGREVAFAAGAIGSPRLVIKSTANVAGGGDVRLADPALRVEWLPAWSADGDFVRCAGCAGNRIHMDSYLGWRACSWHEAGKLGGAVRPAVLPPRARSSYAAWSPDGLRVAFVVADTIFSALPGDTIERRGAVDSSDFTGLHSLAWSPDGKWIAYVNTNFQWLVNGNDIASSIWVVAADGGEPQPVVTYDHFNVSRAWRVARHQWFVSIRDGPRSVFVVEVGPRGARGEPRIIPGVPDPHSISYSVGARKLAWAKFTVRQNVWSYPLARPAPVSIADGEAVTSGSQMIWEHDVSRDGRWLAFDSNRRGKPDIYRMPLAGGEPVPVADLARTEWGPRWSPDGREIAYSIEDPACVGGLWEVAVSPADGGVPRELTCTPAPGAGSYNPRWSPDGLSLAFFSCPKIRCEIWAISRDSVRAVWGKPVPLTDFAALVFEWAPGGQGVLGQLVGESGTSAGMPLPSMFVVSRDGKGQVLWRYDLAATNGLGNIGPDARYSRDGRTLYFGAVHRDGRRGIWAMPAGGGLARQVIAFDDPALDSPFGGQLSIGPDRLYLTVAEYQSDIWVANLRY
ncbi:MAG: hypothetical protein FIB01_01345 [Gemmatimonadetes bacterium]|nr:hypothetical protein [Gemmatimonadota bacterium]